jgi:hypothetical protein
MKLLCIYHKNCADGFAAAWVIHNTLGSDDVEFHASDYGDAPPDVTGRHVLIVDFSYKRPELQAMAVRAKTILVLDHHKKAAEGLVGLPGPLQFREWGLDEDGKELPSLEDRIVPIAALFDMERSGAGLAWDFFNPGDERPPLINYIEDRDLWRFKLPGTREIHAAVMSRPFDFVTWDKLTEFAPAALEAEGVAILRKHNKDVAEVVAMTLRTMIIGGHRVQVANVPRLMASDAGHLMAEGAEFAATYYDTAEGRVFSLRSDHDGMDVNEVAKLYGGGGHVHAAGFKAPPGWEGDAF